MKGGFGVGYCHLSGYRIVAEILGLKVLWSRPLRVMASIAIIGSALAFKAWPFLLLFLLFLAGARLWYRPTSSAHAAGNARPAPAMPVASDRNHQTHMSSIVDQILMRHPHWLEARLIKASILWHIHGDRDGARCHCRDLLGRIQRDNPLFEQVCSLYMSTCRPGPSRSTLPAIKIAAEAGFPNWSGFADAERGDVVPLPSKRLHLTPP